MESRGNTKLDVGCDPLTDDSFGVQLRPMGVQVQVEVAFSFGATPSFGCEEGLLRCGGCGFGVGDRGLGAGGSRRRDSVPRSPDGATAGVNANAAASRYTSPPIGRPLGLQAAVIGRNLLGANESDAL